MALPRWYDENFRRRAVVTIDATAAGSGPGTVDVEIPVPSSFDTFWDNVRSDGKDIVVTNQFGNQLTFQRTSFNYTTQTLTLEVQNASVERGKMCVCYVYFDNPDQTVDLSASFSPSSPSIGQIYLASPSGLVVDRKQNKAVIESPIQTFIKDPDEEIQVWFSLSGLFEIRQTESNGSLWLDGPEYFTVESLDSSGVDDTARFSYTTSRIIDGWAMIVCKGGSSGNDYALRCKIQSAGDYSYVLSCLIKVIKLLPGSA